MDNVFLLAQPGGAALPHHLAFLHHVMAIGDLEQGTNVSIDDDLRQSFPLEFGQRLPDLGPDQRGQPFGCLV
jgi:hypothetical protein